MVVLLARKFDPWKLICMAHLYGRGSDLQTLNHAAAAIAVSCQKLFTVFVAPTQHERTILLKQYQAHK